MNALALELLGVAKEYLGPAAPAFLSRELHALGVTANTVDAAHVLPLAERARQAAAKVMDNKKAGEFAQALAKRGGRLGQPRVAGDHRLASEAAANLFVSGHLRQAEAAYRELIRKYGDVDAIGGLARTLQSLEDFDAALSVLREGAGAYARKGDRVSAIALLGVAVEIAPRDLAAHRRLAAALANQGDLISACEEYGRFIDVALRERDTRRAWLELAYGRETLGDLPKLLAIADRVAAAQGEAMPTPPPPARVAATPSTPATPRPVPPAPAAITAAPAAKPAAPAPTIPTTPTVAAPVSSLSREAAVEAQHRSALAAAVQARTHPQAQASSAVVLKNAKTMTHAEHSDLVDPAELLARAGMNGKPAVQPATAQKPRRLAMPPVDVETELGRLKARGNVAEDAAVADVRATILIGAHDPRAPEAALDAARKLMALHKLHAASDVLLDFIGAGFADREAQRLLIEVNCELGRRETAREKCQLLGTAYRLDGQGAVAEDVERLARIL